MILCVDVGNTSIKCGVYDNEHQIDFFLLNTNKNLTSFEYQKSLEPFLNKHKLEGGIISSVVPTLTEIIKIALTSFINGEVLILNKNLKTKIPIKIDNPSELGSDLLAGAVGAIKKYEYPIVIVDLGTASKIFVVSKEKYFIGGVIYIGLETSMKSLVSNTAQLLEVPFEKNKAVIGKNTKTCIQSGIINGQIYQIREFIKDFEEELGYKLKKVITGGCSKFIKDYLDDFYIEPYLVLDGLNEIYNINQKQG